MDILRRVGGLGLRATGRLHPEVLVFELTHRCNSRCVGCGFREEEPAELPAERWVALAHEARDLGFHELMLTGGEPLARPGIADLLSELSAVLPLVLNTNGLLLKRHVDTLVRTTREIYVSLDGATEETYRAVRGGPGLAQVVAGLTALQGRVHTHARVCIWEDNCEELRAIADLAQRVGFDAVSFIPPDTTSEGFGPRDEMRPRLPRRDQVPRVLRQLDELRAHPLLRQSDASLARVRMLLTDERPTAPRCLAPWTTGVVGPESTWRHCFFLGTSTNVGRGLRRAIDDARSERRRLHVPTNPVCQRCVCWRG